MFSITVINDGEVFVFNSADRIQTPRTPYPYVLRTSQIKDPITVCLQFDRRNDRVWADVWGITNAMRSALGWPEASVVAGNALGFTFYDVGSSKTSEQRTEILHTFKRTTPEELLDS